MLIFFQFNLFNKQMTEVSRDLWVMNMNKNKHIYKTTFTTGVCPRIDG